MKYLLLPIIMICFIGCSAIRKDLIQISKDDLKNAQTTRIVAKNFLSSWKLNSGFLRGAMGDRITELPASALKAIQDLDTLADKTNWTDQELGYSIGLRVRLLGQIISDAIKQFAPELLNYLPMLF